MIITRRSFGRLSASAAVLTKVSPFSFLTGSTESSGEGSDVRRVGHRRNGAYWGHGGEKIDLLSGNLCYSIRLLRAKSRRLGMTLHLTFNSQLWTHHAGILKSYGRDAAAGYGWRLQVASITPEMSDGKLVGYMLVDGVGSEHRLVRNGDVWLSLDGHYITWNPKDSMLWYSNGTSMKFGAIAGIREEDAGTLYPTMLEDSNGNQIRITYLSGSGEAGINTSGKILHIQDARAGFSGRDDFSYAFLYSSDARPHLLSIINTVGSTESYTFSYVRRQVEAPFGGSQEIQATFVNTIVNSAGEQHAFQYSNYGELIQAQSPQGGQREWDYRTFQFWNGRSVREVMSRKLFDPYSPSNTHMHTFERNAGDGGGTVHESMTITGPGGSSRQRWSFLGESTSEFVGHVKEIEDFSNSSLMRRKRVVWKKTDSGIAYVCSHALTHEPGSASERTVTHQVERDSFGNLTKHVQYDYSDNSMPSRIVTHAYLTDSAYIGLHILNRHILTRVQGSDGNTIQLRSSQYDTTAIADRSGLRQHNSSKFGPNNVLRGNVTESYVGGVYKRVQYDVTGLPAFTQDSMQGEVSFVPAEGSNNTLLGMIIPNGNESLGLQIAYESGRPSLITRANGNQTTQTYDTVGRKSVTVFASGRTISHVYGNGPSTITSSIKSRWTRKTHGGFGTVIREETGDESGTHVVVDHVYGPAPHSPIGKLSRRSLPYGPEAEPQWIKYAYDDLGRPVAIDNEGTGSPKKISYAGNAIKMVDPAGRWKTVVHNAQGQIEKVIMPGDSGNSALETRYVYNALGKLISVAMPRGGFTQERNFGYDDGGRVVLAQHVESGQRTSIYNTDGTLASDADAKGQKSVYTRDAYKRVTSVDRFDAKGIPQPSESYKYYYDDNPFEPGFSKNAQGRLAAVRWGNADFLPGLFTEMYSYTVSGYLAAKRLRINRGGSEADLTLYISYDDEGRTSSITYPEGGPLLSYTYDSMGRLNGIVSTQDNHAVVKNVTYNSVGQLTAMKILASNHGTYLVQGYEYNMRNRLKRLTAFPDGDVKPSLKLPTVDIEYKYRSDDGKLQSETDRITSQEVSYNYDQQGRLSSAVSSDDSWGLGFRYDGFGNRTNQTVTCGQGYSVQMKYDPATNWMISDSTNYDLNGNVTELPGLSLHYDTQNRIVRINGVSNERYGYDHRNLRIWKMDSDDSETVTFFRGTENLATYKVIQTSEGKLAFRFQESNVFFQKRLVQAGGEVIVKDRLGTVRAWSTQQGAKSAKYFPFGEEIKSTPDGYSKFDGYDRNSVSGLDYAEQRYYSSGLGRFVTPDPYGKSAHISNPNTWNRYAFVSNDPINRIDPHGLNDGLSAAQQAAAAMPGSANGNDVPNIVQNDDGTTSLQFVNSSTGNVDGQVTYDANGTMIDVQAGGTDYGSPTIYLNSLNADQAGQNAIAAYDSDQANQDNVLAAEWALDAAVAAAAGLEDAALAAAAASDLYSQAAADWTTQAGNATTAAQNDQTWSNWITANRYG